VQQTKCILVRLMMRCVFASMFAWPLMAQDLFLEPRSTNVSLGASLGAGHDHATPTAGRHCIEGTQADQHGWPVFDDQASLQASNWAGYFQDVYGEIPQNGYPICVYNFWWLYSDVKENRGCDEHGMHPKWCPMSEGDYYKYNNNFDRYILNSAFIHHKPPYTGIEENTWAEVTHAELITASTEGHGVWFFYTEGSGIWFWIGKTQVFDEHWEAGLALCHRPVSPMNWDGPVECAQDKGFNSIQFTKRRDPEWLPCSLSMSPRGIEIVGTIGYNGDKLTGTKSCGNDSGRGVFKAGWEASQDCECDNSLDRTNCKLAPGFPPNYS